MRLRRFQRAMAILTGAIVLCTGVAMGQPNWTFSGYLGDGSVMAQGEGLIYYTFNDDIWVTAGDGRNPINLTHTPFTREWNACVSVGRPGGELVVYESDRGNASGDFALWLMNPDGTNARQLTFPPAGVSHMWPSWSPRCRGIVFHEVVANGVRTMQLVDDQDGSIRSVPNAPTGTALWASSFGAGTTAYVRAIDANWHSTAIRIGQDHHAWLYILDHPQDGAPCRASGRAANECGLDDIELAVQLSSNRGHDIHINAYNPIYIDDNFFAQSGCWNGQAGWLEFRFADGYRDDNSGGVIVMLIPVIPGAP